MSCLPWFKPPRDTIVLAGALQIWMEAGTCLAITRNLN
jgi:hypothetical protein